jgi:hypothetical protein
VIRRALVLGLLRIADEREQAATDNKAISRSERDLMKRDELKNTKPTDLRCSNKGKTGFSGIKDGNPQAA